MKKITSAIFIIALIVTAYYGYRAFVGYENKQVAPNAKPDAPQSTEEEKPLISAESDMIGLVINEAGYYNTNAQELIDKAQKTAIDSKEWKEFSTFQDGKYYTNIDQFNIRWSSRNGDYILDYAGDDYRVKITIDGDEVAIYLVDGEFDTIKNFL